MEIISKGIKQLQKLAKFMVRPPGYFTAWNYPRLYLKLLVRLKLNRSKYYLLVQDAKTHLARISLPVTHQGLPEKLAVKNILFVIHWYELSGAELYALYTIKTARELGYQCYCISTVPSRNSELQAFEKFCVEALDFTICAAGRKFQDFISTYVKDKSIQIIHIHHSTMMYEVLSTITRDFPNLLVVDTTHIVEYGDGGFPQLSAKYSPHIDKHNVATKGLIYVQRELFRQQYAEELSLAKFHLTYASGLTQQQHSPTPLLATERKVITFYGRLVLQKQPNIFLATVEYLMEHYPELQVEAHIFGEGEMKSALQSKISRSKHKDKIRYFGRCDDKRTVFEDTDILFLSSMNEGLSFTTYEALTFQTLVVAADVGDQSELLCTDCLVPLSANFVEDAAERLRGFLISPENYGEALAQNNRNLENIRNREINSERVAQLYSQQISR